MKTPQQSYPELATALGVPEVYLKREDLHKYGSHKGRSIPLMIKRYIKDGIREFVISSSGNAALAAAHTTVQHNKNNPNQPITLTIYISPHICPDKLKGVQSVSSQSSAINIHQVEQPKKTALNMAQASNGLVKNLRQSDDDLALEGYGELAQELNKIPHLQGIFIPTSSGTTAQALGEAFLTLDQKPQIHIVQTTACHPMALTLSPLSQGEGQGEGSHSIAAAIVDRVAHRKEKVCEVVKNSGGSGWIISDDEINDAITIVKQTTGLNISPNSALSVAALKKAVASNVAFSGPVVCLITGA